MSLGTTTHHFKARKQHRCTICVEPINKGEVYARVKGQYDGDWQNWKAHDICLEIYRNLDDDDDDYSVECTDWKDLLAMTTIENLCAFIERFPPKDTDQVELLDQHSILLDRISC